MDQTKRRVGIIGTGWVGTSVAISTLHSGAADEILLNDLNLAVAEGEAMDLSHGAAFYQSATVRTASLEEITDVDAIVVSAGHAGGPGESRLNLLQSNTKIIREIGGKLKGSRGVIIMVTNPVDVLTQVMAEASGLPLSRIIGTGTMLDTARLRQVLGRALRLDPRSIHAQVIGEHGDSAVVLWSSARVGGVPLRRWPGWDPKQESVLAEEVRTAAYEIIQRKGSTNHTIGLTTADLLQCMLRGERRVLTVSRVQEGALGIHGVALSLPTVVSGEGAIEVLEPEMSQDECQLLDKSVDVLRSALKQISQT